MAVDRQVPDLAKFNPLVELPFQLRVADFTLAMQDIYDFLFDVNTHLVGKGLQRVDDMLRAANFSGMLSDMMTASMAKHSRSLVVKAHHNGHPDLLVRGQYPGDAVKAGNAVSRSSRPENPGVPWTPTVDATSGCACSSIAWTTSPSQPSPDAH